MAIFIFQKIKTTLKFKATFLKRSFYNILFSKDKFQFNFKLLLLKGNYFPLFQRDPASSYMQLVHEQVSSIFVQNFLLLKDRNIFSLGDYFILVYYMYIPFCFQWLSMYILRIILVSDPLHGIFWFFILFEFSGTESFTHR